MKKIIIALASVAVLLSTACTEDFITVKHNSSEPLDEYFTDESRINESLVAAYDPLKWFDYAFGEYDALNLCSDIMADDIYCGGSDPGDQIKLSKTHFYTLTANEMPGNIWTVCYSGINRACTVLEHVNDVPGLSEEKKAKITAEAGVLKAYFYNILWKFWGNIPYYDENLKTPYTAPQLGHDEVYERIMTKLEETLALNALPMKAASGDEGRVTKAMAYMLYAEMVMYQNDRARYQTAFNYMEEIITSQQYRLVDDFDGMWEESGEWGAESIFEVNYVSEHGYRDWGNSIAPGGTVYPMLIGIPGCNYVYKDAWGFSPVAQHAYDMYEDGDVRKNGGILNFDYFKTIYPDAKYSPRWQDTGNFLKKYIARIGGDHGAAASGDINHCNNQRIYRYAETLLNAAELALELGKDGSKYLKEVRDRAHCTETGTTKDDIIQERRKEFLGEGKRYWDLVRTGQAATVLKAVNHVWRDTDWSESKKYWPIPENETNKDPNLVQNNY